MIASAHCSRCHRPMKAASADGLGPVCRKAVKPAAVIGRDLFGFDVDAACAAALAGINEHIERMAADARYAVRVAFRQALSKVGANA